MYFLAYAPYRLPHSEDSLNKQLLSRGLTVKKWRKNVIRRLKIKVLRDFMTSILKPVFGFGNNCFQVFKDFIVHSISFFPVAYYFCML